ncbi:MAG: NgoBV family restriction endonuclease [Paludibacteraceae bacterium]|nr:NgoBV family restriction endonuclease [Paludibacteraceae bacterium]
MDTSEKLYKALIEDFGMTGAQGFVSFNLREFKITVEQNNIIGNILEEWLDKWMTSKKISHIHNKQQASPDFWLNPDNLETDWLEVKSFTGSPNFDVAAFRSFINLVIEKPWKLHSKHLLIKYKMQNGIVEIEQIWLKNLWEICCTSNTWPIKVQYKNKVIVNIRPATWYSDRTEFKPFESLEDFLAAMEETIYLYPDTRVTIALNWKDKLISSYKKHYGKQLSIPRWSDIAKKYSY